MIAALISGARTARQVSGGSRVVELVVTEVGLIVRGRMLSNGGLPVSHSIALDWPELDANPALPGNAVRLVAQELDRQA